MLEATSALRVTVSVAASPKVKFPEIVALPVTVRLPPTLRSLVVVTLPVSVEVPVTASVEDNVVAPVTPSVLERVVAPVTPNVELSVVAPVTPRVPATVAFASTARVSMVAVPSRYKSLNSSEDVPRSISLSVTGTIAPSCIRTCSTADPETSTYTPHLLLVESTTILLRKSKSPIV